MPKTTIPKKHVTLLNQLKARRLRNKSIERVDNSRLPAGSPMYFYCLGCDDTIVVPESYRRRPKHCPKCLELKELGLLN